jgi:hypothetical protein
MDVVVAGTHKNSLKTLKEERRDRQEERGRQGFTADTFLLFFS